jgi:hypothetical protein
MSAQVKWCICLLRSGRTASLSGRYRCSTARVREAAAGRAGTPTSLNLPLVLHRGVENEAMDECLESSACGSAGVKSHHRLRSLSVTMIIASGTKPQLDLEASKADEVANELF